MVFCISYDRQRSYLLKDAVFLIDLVVGLLQLLPKDIGVINHVYYRLKMSQLIIFDHIHLPVVQLVVVDCRILARHKAILQA